MHLRLPILLWVEVQRKAKLWLWRRSKPGHKARRLLLNCRLMQMRRWLPKVKKKSAFAVIFWLIMWGLIAL
jgi:hypothetical protein